MARRDVVVLGSTGSIGTQALEIVRRNPDRFRVVGLTAGGSRPDLLEQQVAEFAPTFHGTGEDASVEAAALDCDVVLNGISGALGLRPTVAALEAGTTLALANKESLIIGGPVVTDLAKPGQIVAVDSEHSALAQCLRGGRADEVRRLVLTASGGPFRGRSRDDLHAVTPADALNHPTWSMGPLVTVNSATLVNKGLEVIEAHLLFGIPFDRIEVVVHPTSVVHSMVEFVDGSTLLQASPPSMLIPIALGLGWPDRIPGAAAPVDWTSPEVWEFTPLDDEAFPAVRLAREAGAAGGVMPAVYNAANEVCVARFLDGRLRFTDIVPTIERVLRDPGVPSDEELTVTQVLHADAWARERAETLLAAPGDVMITVLLFVLGVVVFAVGVAVSIGLHEVGHMVPAKKFGVKVTQYFVGFGRTVWSTRRGETEYGLKAIPLGGYVKLVGMLPPAKDDPLGRPRQSNTGMFTQLISDARHAEAELIKPGDEDRLFYRLPWWKKVIVMAGGPTVNLVIAFLLFAGIFGIYGVPEPTTTVSAVSECVITSDEVGRECTADDEVSPAAEAGMLPGDRIVTFNGEEITGWEQMVRLIQDNGEGLATVGIVRDGQDLTLETSTTVNSVRSVDDREVVVEAGFLGVTPTTVQEQHGLLYTTEQMGVMTWDVTQALVRLPAKVYDVGQAVLGLEERAADSPVSIVGAGRVAGEVTSDQTSPAVDRLVFLVGLLASLNLFVGMFNFIPLLPLDGGHIAGALYEGARRGVARVRGRPDPGFVDVAKLLPVAYVVGVSLLVMGLILITADIVVPIEV